MQALANGMQISSDLDSSLQFGQREVRVKSGGREILGENLFCRTEFLKATLAGMRQVISNDSADQTSASLAYPTIRNFLFSTWCHVARGNGALHRNELTAAREKLSVSVLHSGIRRKCTGIAKLIAPGVSPTYNQSREFMAHNQWKLTRSRAESKLCYPSVLNV